VKDTSQCQPQEYVWVQVVLRRLRSLGLRTGPEGPYPDLVEFDSKLVPCTGLSLPKTRFVVHKHILSLSCALSCQ
jgi:hypothetical protein